MAHDPADFQPDGTAAGEFEDQSRWILEGIGADGEQRQDPVLLARIEAAATYGLYIVDAEARKSPFMVVARLRLCRLPAEPVGDEHELALLGQIDHLADGH